MKKSGINAQFINTNNFVDTVRDSNFSSDSTTSQISDKIRYYSGNFWNKLNNNVLKYNKLKLFDVEQSEDGEILTLTADKTKFTSQFFDENNIIRTDYDKNLWRRFTSYVTPQESETFFDHYSIVSKPVNVAEKDNTTDLNLSYLNREFVYNFHNPNFESLVTNPVFNVLSIPSAYYVYSDNNTSTRSPDENLFLSLGGYVPSSLVENLSTATSYNESIGAYFDSFVTAYNNPEAQLAARRVLQIQDFNITKTKADVFNKIKGRFIPFPFYVYMEMGNQSSKTTDFIHVLDEQLGDMSSGLLEFIQNSSPNNKVNFITTDGKPKEEKITQYDLKNWILFNTNPQNTIGSYVSPENSTRFSNLLQYISKNLKTKRREYNKFMTDSCHQEVLYYKIEKRQFKTSQDPIQTYFIYPTKSEVIKFFDSQVKYGVEYFYKVSAYTLVIGNKYSYKNYYTNDIEKQRDIANGVYKLRLDNAADYRILDIPLVEFSGVIQESPYTKPKAAFDFNNNKLFVTLQQSALEEEEQFQIIENKDFDLFEMIRKSQDNFNSLNIKAYQNTGDTKTLEIYKIATKPNNYISFQNKRYRTVTMTKNQSMFYDTILPNKKYYYLFRYLNQHGIPSNVSEVYEIFLMDEDGLQTLQVNKLNLTAEQKLTDYKELGRYLLIRPSIIQLQPQSSTVENIQDVVLGPKEDTVWGKRFMLKITSKSTGREIKLRFGVGLDRKQN